jgi:hypothetical protein
VNNNNAFTQGVYLWEAAYGGKLHGRHHEMWQFRDTNFANIAREMGVPATRVEQPSELARALRTGQLPLEKYLATLELRFADLEPAIQAFMPEPLRFVRLVLGFVHLRVGDGVVDVVGRLLA